MSLSFYSFQRISTRDRVIGKVYDYPEPAGEGVDVYVVDGGVKVEIPDFQGRAVWGASFVDRNATKDDGGHGTHVAGTIGSKTYGVAKKANIIAVRVIGKRGQGSSITVCQGL